MRQRLLILGAFLVADSLAFGPPDWSLDPSGKLTVPRDRGRGRPGEESIVLRLKVAPLPDGAEIEVSTLDKAVVGGVAPFGVRPGSKARYYSIPIPAKAVADDKVTVRLEVVEKAGKRRPPARSEIEDAVLAYTPAARPPGGKKP